MVITLSSVSLAVVLYIIYALAGLNSKPVTFAPPPKFVEQYALENFGSVTPQRSEENETVKLTRDYFNEAALVRNTIVNGQPVDELMRRFTHADKATRVKIAFAFAEVNIKLSHDEGTDFDDKRVKFWKEVEAYSDDIQNALFEALITSAEEGTRNFIPYTLAWWMQSQKGKALDILSWAAKHHSDTWVRNFCVYYIVQFGDSETHAKNLLQDRINDPDFQVRKQVFDQRIRRLKEILFGKEE